MENLARKLENGQAFQEYGRIVNCDGAAFDVETESDRYSARRAVSCLVRPEVGDLVLVSIGVLGAVYILSVLEREPEAKTTLSFSSDVDIQTESGRMAIAARDGLLLAGGRKVTIASLGISVQSRDGDINIERLNIFSRLVKANLDIIKLLAGTWDSILDRLFTRTRRSYRQVEEIEQVRAGQMHYQARTSLRMRGRFSQLTAEEDVQIDGRQIHLG